MILLVTPIRHSQVCGIVCDTDNNRFDISFVYADGIHALD